MAMPSADRLVICGMRVRYGPRTVLSDVSLPPLAQGQMIGLLGPNAAGKSTLLKALVGQVRYEGSARFGTTELSSLSHRGRCGLIGYVPQTPPQPSALLVYEFALSILRTTLPRLSNAEAEARIEEAFGQMGLTGEATRPVAELSGGKRQLLGVSQILARRTALILLDEPTSALDLRWRVEALSVIRALTRTRGALAVVALHDLNLALRFCDHVVLLGDGRVLADGPAETTLSSDLLRTVYGVEARLETCSQGRPFIIVDRAATHAPCRPRLDG